MYILSTTPGEISNLTEYLKQLASQIGIKESLFSKVLNLMGDDVEAGLTEYENAVEKLLKNADESSFPGLFPPNPGIGGLHFDINMAIKRYKNGGKGRSAANAANQPGWPNRMLA